VSKRHPVQIHHEAHDKVKAMMEETGLRPNVVILAAIKR
jgi:hypothetical protein